MTSWTDPDGTMHSWAISPEVEERMRRSRAKPACDCAAPAALLLFVFMLAALAWGG